MQQMDNNLKISDLPERVIAINGKTVRGSKNSFHSRNLETA
jgi:hypothetical protein